MSTAPAAWIPRDGGLRALRSGPGPWTARAGLLPFALTMLLMLGRVLLPWEMVHLVAVFTMIKEARILQWKII